MNILNLFKWFRKEKTTTEPKIVVTEGVSGTWYYHLSYDTNTTRSLCGEHVMPTNFPRENWGYVGHLKERYCPKCKKISEDNSEKSIC